MRMWLRTDLWMIFHFLRWWPVAEHPDACLDGRLASQLALALEARKWQPPVGDRRPDGAARLAFVGAVGEATVGGKRVDVGEGIGKAVVDVPHADRAHARAVDQQRARMA